MCTQLSRKDAIDYIYKSRKGTLESLKNDIGEKNLQALQLTGFIKRGQESSGTNSWSITTKAINFIEIINSKNKYSFFDKIQNFINSFLVNKSLTTTSL